MKLSQLLPPLRKEEEQVQHLVERYAEANHSSIFIFTQGPRTSGHGVSPAPPPKNDQPRRPYQGGYRGISRHPSRSSHRSCNGGRARPRSTPLGREDITFWLLLLFDLCVAWVCQQSPLLCHNVICSSCPCRCRWFCRNRVIYPAGLCETNLGHFSFFP